MKSVTLITLLVVFSHQGFGQRLLPSRIPSKVRTALRGRFTSEEVEWYQEGLNYRATFAIEGKKNSLVFSPIGELALAKIEIDKGEMPKPVMDVLSSNYKWYKLEEMHRIEGRGKIFFEVHLEYDYEKIDLVFNKDGKILEEKLER